MSEAVNPETEGAEAPKKRGKKLILLLLLLIMLGGGAYGGYYFFMVRGADAEEESEEKADSPDAKKAKSKKKSAEEKSSNSKSSKSKDAESEESPAGDDENVKKIIELQPFIVNLADSDQARYLRLNVSIGIGGEGEGESEKPDQLFTTRVRSALLAVLSTKTSEEVLSVQGKAKLRKELLKAAQEASEEPRVEAIYITDFIIQM